MTDACMGLIPLWNTERDGRQEPQLQSNTGDRAGLEGHRECRWCGSPALLTGGFSYEAQILDRCGLSNFSLVNFIQTGVEH